MATIIYYMAAGLWLQKFMIRQHDGGHSMPFNCSRMIDTVSFDMAARW